MERDTFTDVSSILKRISLQIQIVYGKRYFHRSVSSILKRIHLQMQVVYGKRYFHRCKKYIEKDIFTDSSSIWKEILSQMQVVVERDTCGR